MRKLLPAVVLTLALSGVCVAGDFNLGDIGNMIHTAQQAEQAYEVYNAANSLMHGGDAGNAVNALESLAGYRQQPQGALGAIESALGGGNQYGGSGIDGLANALGSLSGELNQNMGQGQGYGYQGMYHPHDYGHSYNPVPVYNQQMGHGVLPVQPDYYQQQGYAPQYQQMQAEQPNALQGVASALQGFFGN